MNILRYKLEGCEKNWKSRKKNSILTAAESHDYDGEARKFKYSVGAVYYAHVYRNRRVEQHDL